MTTPIPIPETRTKAPAFTLPMAGGGKVRLSEFKGRPVVLYFYPKDDTPGCTAEAVDFSAHKAKFDRANTIVIGISKDSIERHDKFKAKHKLSVILASDEDGATLARYGVWVEKNMYGRKYMGIQRATFLIDAAGIIRRVWPKVKVKGHADEVLAAAKAL